MRNAFRLKKLHTKWKIIPQVRLELRKTRSGGVEKRLNRFG